MLGLEKWWPTQMEPDDDGPSLAGVRLSSTEWQRRTARLERDELIAEPSGLVEWRYAPARVSWTRTEPVVPGLYAVRVPGGPRRVVEVVADQRGRLTASWGNDVPEFPVARCGFEFAGPYMEPE